MLESSQGDGNLLQTCLDFHIPGEALTSGFAYIGCISSGVIRPVGLVEIQGKIVTHGRGFTPVAQIPSV